MNLPPRPLGRRPADGGELAKTKTKETSFLVMFMCSP
jgi:hypothetical protein